MLITKNNRKIHIEDSVAPIFDRDNNLLGVVLVFRDVTEKKKMQKEIIKIEKLQTVGTLAAGIAHDFNNILTGVYGNISLAKMFISNKEKLSDLLCKAEKSLDKAKALTSQLLTFSKGGALVKRIASIDSIIKDTVDFVLTGSDIEVIYNFPENIYKVNVDSEQISQVFNNLALNSKDAMKKGGKIFITIENIEIYEPKPPVLKPGKYVKIIFRDTGVGIDEKVLPNIFDPFFTTKEKGSGLGLATSYAIIQNHDGYIDVFSKKGEGTTFIIYLPACEESFIEKVNNNGSNEIKYYKKLKILIMDDSIDIREHAKELFAYLGHNVETAVNGEEAIEKYKNAMKKGEKFDIVILDLTVKGGMGGKQTIKEFLKIDKDVKAVVSSGYSDDPVMSNYKEFGFIYALTKPYTLKEVKKMLQYFQL